MTKANDWKVRPEEVTEKPGEKPKLKTYAQDVAGIARLTLAQQLWLRNAVIDGKNARIQLAKENPDRTEEDRREYLRRECTGEEAWDMLWWSSLGDVYEIALRIQESEEDPAPLNDLIRCGECGLNQAINAIREWTSGPFLTFCTPYIEGAMKDKRKPARPVRAKLNAVPSRGNNHQELLEPGQVVYLSKMLREGQKKRRLLELNFPEDTQSLAALKEENREVWGTLVCRNRGLVFSAAAEAFRSYPQITYEQYVSYGEDALVKAVNNFDWRLGYLFSTYATDCIKKAMKSARRKEEAISTPNDKYRLIETLQEAEETVRSQGVPKFGIPPKEPDENDLANYLGWHIDKVREVRQLWEEGFVSSTPPVGDDDEDGPGLGMEETVADSGSTPEQEMVESFDNDLLWKTVDACLENLSSADRTIVELFLGLGEGSQKMEESSIAVATGYPRARISRVTKEFLGALLEALGNVDIDVVQKSLVADHPEEEPVKDPPDQGEAPKDDIASGFTVSWGF